MTALLAMALASGLASPAPPSRDTALYFRCRIAPEAAVPAREMDVTYFTAPPGRAMAFNVRDPGQLLPADAHPFVRDQWPVSLEVKYYETDQMVAVMTFSRAASPLKAGVEIRRIPGESAIPVRGACSVVEGEAAKRQYMELLGQ